MLGALLLGWAAFASPVRASGPGRTLPVCIQRVAIGDGDARAALRRSREFDCRKPQIAWGPGDYWAVSQPIAGYPAHEALLVRNYAMWQARETLWALYADGAVIRLAPARNAGSMGTGIVHLLPARHAAPTRLLWRIEGAGNTRGIVAGARVFTLPEYARANTGVGIMVGWFAGLAVGFLFFNAVLWLALRRQFQLAYCAMVSGLLLYVAADAGLVRRMVYDFGPLAELKMSSLTFALCVVGGTWFARSFLEPEVVGLRLKRFNQAASAAMLAAGLVQAALPPSRMLLIDKVQGIAFLLGFASLLAMAWRAWTRRSALRWIWSATAIVPALLAGMRAANSFPMLGTLFAMRDWMLAMMAGGMFASSLAIAYRIHLVARERDAARAGETVARLLADTDPLTGMLNRRAFLAQAIGREGDQLLMLVDIDHFKQVNETIGHDGGDDVLRAIGRALEAAIPTGALAARIGGEEFAIVAPVGLDLDANDILDHIRSARMPYDLSVTASIGACTGPLRIETDWKAMYRDADRALFAAKSAGRDRVRRAPVLAVAA